MKYDRILLEECHHCGSTKVTAAGIIRWYNATPVVGMCDRPECKAWIESLGTDKEFITLEEAQLIAIKERL